MKTYAAYIVVLVLFALAVGALLLYAPRSATIALQGRINPKGELVATDGKVFVIANFGSLGKDWMGKEIEVTGYVRRPGVVPAEGIVGGRDTIEVHSYHVVGSSTWWDNCVASCEPHEIPFSYL